NMVPYTILDLGTGLPSPIRDAVNMCDDIVVLVEPTEHTITHTKALLSNLAEMQVSKNEIKLVLNNRVRMDLSVPIPDIPKRLGHNFAGIINPAPELFYQASLRRLPAILYQSDSLAAKQIMKLAETITIPIALPS
ncbi:MAG: hypothetical protein OEZ02_13855, partial [Anaerolineae bacterium]|nr:hypothetical protein [Anaerolineae bacterium]